MEQEITRQRFSVIYSGGLAGLVTLALFWAYWSPLAEMVSSWSHNPQYSHGFLVPIFSCCFLYQRSRQFQSTNRKGSFWGISILLAAIIVRLAGTYFYYIWLDPISLLPAIAGIVVVFFGWPVLRMSWPAIAFLFFMIPLPHNLSMTLAAPLQRVATETSTFVLQVLGQPAVAEGNVILLNEFELGVVEACSGLRMLMVFFAIATAFSMYLKKPWLEKGLLVVSAIPIAIISNVMRIAVTGILYETTDKEFAELVFHDLAGWLMMPLALGFLAVEIMVLSRLFPRNQAIEQGELPVTTKIFATRIKRNRPVDILLKQPSGKLPSKEQKLV